MKFRDILLEKLIIKKLRFLFWRGSELVMSEVSDIIGSSIRPTRRTRRDSSSCPAPRGWSGAPLRPQIGTYDGGRVVGWCWRVDSRIVFHPNIPRAQSRSHKNISLTEQPAYFLRRVVDLFFLFLTIVVCIRLVKRICLTSLGLFACNDNSIFSDVAFPASG